MTKVAFAIPFNEIAQFCQRWRVHELAVFGSALREDFGLDSDLDVLVTFDPAAEWSLLDHVKMEQELEQVFQRSVDLISKRALERSANWLLRREIVETAQVIFSEQEVADAAR
jgi:predicted nucleotidyltransferase